MTRTVRDAAMALALTVMADEARLLFAELARRYDLRVIEDDAYGLLPSEPLPAIASLAPLVRITSPVQPSAA